MSGGTPDPRTHAYRDDLAAEYLQGRVNAPRYVTGDKSQVIAAVTAMRREPRHDAPLDTEILLGETLTVYDEHEGWAWAQAESDSYVGYVSADVLEQDVFNPTHRVSALRTYLFPMPDIKAPPLELVSINALVAVEKTDGRFAILKDGRFAIAAHLVPVDEHENDFVSVAEQFLGAPYLWGGRTSIGLDCSALIQLSLQAAGIECPRDTDMQEAALGKTLPEPQDQGAYQRGDLLFWKGHVGVMLDDRMLLHSNAHHMATVIEPVAEAAARIAAAESPVTSVHRLG